MKRVLSALVVGSLVLLASPATADAQARKLSDSELDRVTAGGVNAPAPAIPVRPASGSVAFEFKSPAGSRHTVEGNGSVQVLETDARRATSSLLLSDNAQQNLQSLINVTAVNSMIQVLVNLNISINSAITSLNQINAPSGP
jgi:hypothetical protein